MGDSLPGVELVVITGHSGAGKSEAIAAFEDGGYFCVDNLPPKMIAGLGELFRHEGSGVERAAVVSDARGGEYFEDLIAVIGELEAGGLDTKVLFLEADEDTLLDRYKETRRRHPLARSGRIVDGIREERKLLAPLRERADVVIDTTDLTGGELRRRIATELVGGERGDNKLALTLLSFGFKKGPRATPTSPSTCASCPTPLRGRAATADRARPARQGLHRGRHPGRRVLRSPDAAARVPAARLRRRGQAAPDDRDRLHRRAPSLDRGGRPDRARARQAR